VLGLSGWSLWCASASSHIFLPPCYPNLLFPPAPLLRQRHRPSGRHGRRVRRIPHRRGGMGGRGVGLVSGAPLGVAVRRLGERTRTPLLLQTPLPPFHYHPADSSTSPHPESRDATRSIIWHLGLDPIKWLMAWALNEDGVRSRASFAPWLRGRARDPTKTGGLRGRAVQCSAVQCLLAVF